MTLLLGNTTESGDIGGVGFTLTSAVWLPLFGIESLPDGMMILVGERAGRIAQIVAQIGSPS